MARCGSNVRNATSIRESGKCVPARKRQGAEVSRESSAAASYRAINPDFNAVKTESAGQSFPRAGVVTGGGF